MTDAATPSPGALLDLEIAGYKALLRLLDAECDALRRLDAEAIAATAAAKQEQVRSLEQLARMRERALDAAGLPSTGSGIALWLAASGEHDGFAGAWPALLDLARAARSANARNGRLLARQHRHFDGALAALLQAAGVPATYGADGRPRTSVAGRSLAAI